MRALIIIPAARQAELNALSAAQFDPVGGAATFTVPLFARAAPDDATPSHYWAGAQFTEANWQLAQQLAAAMPDVALLPWPDDAAATFAADALAARSLRTGRASLTP